MTVLLQPAFCGLHYFARIRFNMGRTFVEFLLYNILNTLFLR